jgi:hypothetical protein
MSHCVVMLNEFMVKWFLSEYIIMLSKFVEELFVISLHHHPNLVS